MRLEGRRQSIQPTHAPIRRRASDPLLILPPLLRCRPLLDHPISPIFPKSADYRAYCNVEDSVHQQSERHPTDHQCCKCGPYCIEPGSKQSTAQLFARSFERRAFCCADLSASSDPVPYRICRSKEKRKGRRISPSCTECSSQHVPATDIGNCEAKEEVQPNQREHRYSGPGRYTCSNRMWTRRQPHHPLTKISTVTAKTHSGPEHLTHLLQLDRPHSCPTQPDARLGECSPHGYDIPNKRIVKSFRGT